MYSKLKHGSFVRGEVAQNSDVIKMRDEERRSGEMYNP